MHDDYAPIPGRLARLGFEDLAEFHNSDLWYSRRELWRLDHPAHWHCFVCGRRDDLQLHHVSYARLGAERDEDLVPLCSWHHTAVHHTHAIAGVPLAIAHEVHAEVDLGTGPWPWHRGNSRLEDVLSEPDPFWAPIYRWVPDVSAAVSPPAAWPTSAYRRVPDLRGNVSPSGEWPMSAAGLRRARLRSVVADALLALCLAVLGVALYLALGADEDGDISMAFWACVIVLALVRRTGSGRSSGRGFGRRRGEGGLRGRVW